MARWTLLLLGLLFTAAPLSAEFITDYQDDVYLRDHETVRYKVNIDYGTGTDASIDVLVRGFDGPPRVRILDDNRHEIKDVRDHDGDWTVNPSITAHDPIRHYYVEVDSALPSRDGNFEVTITLYAPTGNAADGEIFFDKYYFDYESGDESDHYDCSVHAGAGSWPLALLALTALSALYLGRRRKPAAQKARVNEPGRDA
jgi:MYXO-CTERM domain-containing protein